MCNFILGKKNRKVIKKDREMVNINKWINQRTHKYLKTDNPNTSFMKKKSRNTHTYHSKEKKQTKNPLATHPQNTLAQPLDLDFLLIKWDSGYNSSFNWHKLTITTGSSKMIKIYEVN